MFNDIECHLNVSFAQASLTLTQFYNDVCLQEGNAMSTEELAKLALVSKISTELENNCGVNDPDLGMSSTLFPPSFPLPYTLSVLEL